MDHSDSLPPIVPHMGPLGVQMDAICLFGPELGQ